MNIKYVALLCACALSLNLFSMENKELAEAITKGDLTTFTTLFQTGHASVNDTCKNFPLLFYTVRSYKWSIDPSSHNAHYEDKAKNMMAAHNIMRMITFLLNNNAPVNLTIPYGSTPLHLACALEEIKPNLEPHVLSLITLLLKHGAHIAAQTSQGETPLHLAATYGRNSSVIALLLKHGANTEVRNHEWLTAYDIAIKELDKAVNIYEGELDPKDPSSHAFHRSWLNYIDDLQEMQNVFEKHQEKQREKWARFQRFQEKKPDVMFSFK